MGIYEEVQGRGLIAQVTDEEKVRNLVNSGQATFYIGFDPTADSLHVGHFIFISFEIEYTILSSSIMSSLFIKSLTNFILSTNS